MLAFLIAVISYNIKTKELYGSYPIFSATGGGFQYLRAKNQFESGSFKDENIFFSTFKSDKYKPDLSIRYSVVTNSENISKNIDKFGTLAILSDISTPEFFTKKLPNGFWNTVSSGLFPDTVFVILYIVFFVVLVFKNTIYYKNNKNDSELKVLSIIFLIYLILLSVVGFKMKYAYYTLASYPLLLILLVYTSMLIKRRNPNVSG